MTSHLHKYRITLELTLDETETVMPDKGGGWDWHELLDLGPDEDVVVTALERVVDR